jgi:formylglycine-generating enzyme required for sulfatase activity
MAAAAASASAVDPSTTPTVTSGEPPSRAEPETVEQQRATLLETLRREHDLAPPQLAAVARIVAHSALIGQGNPRISVHPIGRDECLKTSQRTPLRPGDPACGRPHMVPLYDPKVNAPSDASVCIDQFEFPGAPCEYPIVHVSAREAVQLCEAVGKRLCDAHEWEGACAGALLPASGEYAFGLDRRAMRTAHNRKREIVWAYGVDKDHARCATTSFKTPSCPGSGYERCGSNTFPTGAFPGCVSPLGVYDLHGNVAEHMNLPMRPSELGRVGGHGFTEMKGSWFSFATTEAHPDDCRWRAPDWHGSSVTSPRSHSNYHLGFRCCRDVPAFR